MRRQPLQPARSCGQSSKAGRGERCTPAQALSLDHFFECNMLCAARSDIVAGRQLAIGVSDKVIARARGAD
jgi:hypothetical protein